MFSGKLSWNCYLTVCFGIVCLVLKVNSEVKTHHVDSGESVTLECEVAAPDVDVPFIVQWKKQGIDAPIYLKFENYPAHIDPQFYGRVSLFDQASLQIVNVQAEDDGWYECKVMFLNGEHDQLKNGTWARLRVRAPPAFAETSPSRVIFAPGSDMTLLCRTTGNPPPTITWYKDEQLIKPGPRTTFVDGSITLYKVGVGDSGAYTCTAESNAGTSTHVIRVIIQGPPHFVIEPANVTVQEDGQALFECVAEGAPSSINYRWYKDNVEIERLTNLNHRLQMLLEGSLLIHTVRPSDEGVFTCRPDNGVGVPPSASAHLTVLYPAYVPKMPATSYLPKGLKGIIHCPIRANPPPTRVEWTKDWKDLLPDELPRYSVAKNGHLEIKDVEKEDEGRYTCIPHNALGTRGESLPTYVFVEDPPYFTDRPRSVYQREVGQQVTFPCAAKGNPEPTIKWRKADGTEPADRAYYNNGRLTISYLRKEDHGKYECIAENVVATVVTVTELIIESTTPHAPTNITILAGIYTAMVSWVPAYNGGFPQHYEIWYKKLHADVELWDKVTIADEHATSVILYNLDPSTIYEVSVIAKNTLGDSLFSDVMLMTTKEPGQYVPIPTDHTGLLARLPAHGPTGTRPNPPQSVSVNETETGLVIHWQAPPNASKPIVQYIIEYRIGDQEWQILEDNIPASQLMYIPDDLEPSTHYSFRVFSLTETAFSEPSQVVLAYTGDIPVYYSQDEFPTPMVAAIVGALCFLVVISLLATVGILRLHRKRKDKKHVSFADSVEAANRRTDKRTKTDSNDSAPKRTQLPKLKPLLTPFFSRLKEKYQKRGLRRKMKKKGNWSTSSGLKQNKGVTAKETMLVEKSRFPKKYKVSSHRVEVSYSGPISRISRSADGKFVLRPENEYVDDVVQSRPDLLPDYHDDMAGVFAASSESTTSFTTDENCSATITGSTDSQLKPPPPPPGPKVTYVAPQTAYKPEGAQLASSPAEQHDAKPLKIDDVSALRVSPSEISGWEKWTKEEVYEIMHRMQELGYESAYGGYDLESEMNENDDFDLESVRYSEKSDSYSQFANVCANGYPPFAQSYEQLGRPRVAANFGRPHSSMVELMSRGPSERTPIYSPTRPNANPITPSTLQNFSSIRASPDSSSQHTISVDVHRTDEDSQMAGAGDYVRNSVAAVSR
ncbi:protein turtle homolog B-like [Ptychodera flava]|uniref:protein turtle homolog B-like n=1 Tax=Ptychodera flava TaxID=63121 RepID=UPI00396A68C6